MSGLIERQIERHGETEEGRERRESEEGEAGLAFSFSEIQFNQRHLCKGGQLFLGGDLSRVLVRGPVFEVPENYHFLPITVPGMEKERGSGEKPENLVNLLHPDVPGCAPDT